MAGLHDASKLLLSSKGLLTAFDPCRWSGITPENLANITVTLEDVQERIRALLPPNAILVGHSLESDLKALKVQPSADEPITALGRHANGHDSHGRRLLVLVAISF
jgi:DNA polymerase III epsilon subunit-like protein